MFSNMLVAERRLLDACQKGEMLDFGDTRPTEKTVDNEIRGEFLKTLICSNNKEIDENSKKYILKIDPRGIHFKGVYISGIFDFSFCNTDLAFIFLNSFFENQIILIDSKIKLLILSGSKITSIIAQRLICDSDIFLRNGFESNGEINFISAQIIGNLNCVNGKFLNKNGNVLNCNSAKIKGSVFLKDGFESNGEVNFVSTQIGGEFDCSDAKLTNQDSITLNCNGVTISGTVFLRDGFESKGEVDFTSSKIGSLECTGGKFLNEKTALSFNSAKINGMVYLNNSFESRGKIDFISAEIFGNLDCGNGKFNANLSEKALDFEGARINKSVFLNNNFEAKGIIDFGYSQIGNTLELSKLNIKGNFILTSAKINVIWIDDNFWKKKDFGNIQLDGLQYEHLDIKDLNSEILINLLDKMPKNETFKTQPYRQLVKVLRNNGDNIYADDVMIKYNDIQTSKNNFILKFFKTIYKFTTGYGYRPKNMLCTLIIVWLFFGWIYQKTAEMAVFAPSNPLIFQKKDFYQCLIDENGTSFSDLSNQKEYNEQNNWTKSKKLEGEYTTFQPYIYSLDLILPVVDLQMNKDWGVFISPINSKFTLNDLIRWIVWIEIIIGWTLGYILLSYFSGIISKRD